MIVANVCASWQFLVVGINAILVAADVGSHFVTYRLRSEVTEKF